MLFFESRTLLGRNKRLLSQKVSKQMKVTSYSLFQTKIVQINEWKQTNVQFFGLIDIAQLLSFS